MAARTALAGLMLAYLGAPTAGYQSHLPHQRKSVLAVVAANVCAIRWKGWPCCSLSADLRIMGLPSSGHCPLFFLCSASSIEALDGNEPGVRVAYASCPGNSEAEFPLILSLR